MNNPNALDGFRYSIALEYGFGPRWIVAAGCYLKDGDGKVIDLLQVHEYADTEEGAVSMLPKMIDGLVKYKREKESEL